MMLITLCGTLASKCAMRAFCENLARYANFWGGARLTGSVTVFGSAALLSVF